MSGRGAELDAPVDVGADQGLFVYGVMDGDGEPTGSALDDLSGLDGRPVVLVRAHGLAAAVSTIDLERPPGRRADLLGYQAVLDRLVDAAPVAPVRFGSVLPDTDAVVEELLAPRRDQFAAVLEQVRGRRQFNLRATYIEEAVLADLVAVDPRVRELRERTRDLPEEASYADRVRLGELVARSLEERSDHDAGLILDAVVPLTAAHLVRTPPSATQVVDVALLVDDDRADELVGTLEDLAEAVHERIRLRLLGPLAAYDFVDGATWA